MDYGTIDERAYLFNIMKKGCRKIPTGNLVAIILGFIFLVAGIIIPVALSLTTSGDSADIMAVSLSIPIAGFVCFASLITISIGFAVNTCKILKEFLLNALRKSPVIAGAAKIKAFMNTNNTNHAQIKELLDSIDQESIDSIYQRMKDQIYMSRRHRYHHRNNWNWGSMY
jgi:hypothetical protein